jgi:hypothetical protein
MVLTLAFAVPLAVVVEQRAETVPFARLCAEVAAIGESPNLAPLRDSFQMAQIRGECHAPHPPGTEVLGSPFGLALGFTFVMAFACLLVSALARELGTIWFIPALLIYAGLSGFFVGLMLTSKEGWGPLDYACENVKTIARSSEWASVQDRPEMAEMRAACGLQARPS